MSEPPNPFQTATRVRSEGFGSARTALRRRPELHWHDAQGAHAVALSRRLVAGSAPHADLRIGDPTVSRLHAEFELTDDGVWVRDLGSTNGTYVGGVRVGSAQVPERCPVRLGDTEIAVEYSTPATAVELWPEDTFGPLRGRSAAMRELFALLARVAASETTVLIEGETGTGKELVARAIHEASPRAAGPFVVIDCAALPEQLLEAELFGHTRGAFTGATVARAGAMESAEGGTIFLDEIGELPLAMQPKLLRALESRTIRRLGETAHRRVDVRFLAATHRDLRTMVNAGAFREDLYFRLAVVPVTVPPLRARPDDVALLVEHFLPREAGAPSPELIRELSARPWLGNVRELRNFVERAVALGPQRALALGANTGLDPNARTSVMPSGPPPTTATPSSGSPSGSAEVPDEFLDLPFRDARERWLDRFERGYVLGLLARHARSALGVAQAAGLDKSYVHKLIKRHGL